MIGVETYVLDTRDWYAALVVFTQPPEPPRIESFGFTDRVKRDRFLAWVETTIDLVVGANDAES